MNKPTNNHHLPSLTLASKYAAAVEAEGRKAEVLAAIGQPQSDVRVEIAALAATHFDTGGVLFDDAYMDAVLDALKHFLG